MEQLHSELRPMTATFTPDDRPAPLALSVREAARLIGIGPTKIYELFASGEIVPRKIGRRSVVLRADLERFLNNLPTADAAGKAGAAK